MSFIRHFFRNFLGLLPLRKIIVFESRPDFSDNTFMVFKELVDRRVDKKYKFVWLCHNDAEKPKDYRRRKNIIFLDVNKHHFLSNYYSTFARVVVCCNRFIGSGFKKQYSFYLMHGSPIKDTSAFYKCPSRIKWMITPSDAMLELSAKTMCFDKTKCVGLGFPRNDAFFGNKINLKDMLGEYSKIIAWYPTVRNYTNGLTIEKMKDISFIDDYANASELNSLLADSDILLIVKIHFAQKNSPSFNANFSNILFLDNAFFSTNHISSYEFLSATDALLTDYSSVYYDYLFADKPIGLVWDDLEIFKKELGVVDGFDQLTAGGEKIYTFDELKQFILRVSNNTDLLREKRNQVCKSVNRENDGLNASRVCDFIMSTAGIKVK